MRQPLDLSWVVTGQDDGQIRLPMQLSEGFLDAFCIGSIHMRGWLVEQDHVWAKHQQASQRHALPLAPREFDDVHGGSTPPAVSA